MIFLSTLMRTNENHWFYTGSDKHYKGIQWLSKKNNDNPCKFNDFLYQSRTGFQTRQFPIQSFSISIKNGLSDEVIPALHSNENYLKIQNNNCQQMKIKNTKCMLNHTIPNNKSNSCVNHVKTMLHHVKILLNHLKSC